MHYVTITTKGWEAFNGDLVGVKFKDGTSVDPLPRFMVDRISALVACKATDTDGNDLGQSGVAARLSRGREVGATAVKALKRMTEADYEAEQREILEAAGKPAADTIYTKEQLEDIAGKDGIDGLRKISNRWGVKDRAINRLIDGVLKAQDAYLARAQERAEEARRAKEATTKEALDKQRAQEAAIDAQARILNSVDTTPNTINDKGVSVYVEPKTDDPVDAEDPAAIEAAAKAAIEEAGAANSAANEAIAEQGATETQ